MSWDGIVAGAYHGQVHKLTIKDKDAGTAIDVSGYTTGQEMILYDPENNSTTVTAAFDSDGSDGVIKYTRTTTDIHKGGNWAVRAVVESATAKLPSLKLYFDVED